METVNNTQNIQNDETAPTLGQVFQAAMPEHILKKLEARKQQNQPKKSAQEKQAIADQMKQEKLLKFYKQKQEEVEKHNKVLDLQKNGHEYYKELQTDITNRKLKDAEESVSYQLINKITKAQQHNEKVNQTRIDHKMKLEQIKMGYLSDENEDQLANKDRDQPKSRRDQAEVQKMIERDQNEQKELAQEWDPVLKKQADYNQDELGAQKGMLLMYEKKQKAKLASIKFTNNEKLQRKLRSVSNKRAEQWIIYDENTKYHRLNKSPDTKKKEEEQKSSNVDAKVPEKQATNVNVQIPISFEMNDSQIEDKKPQNHTMNQEQVHYIGGKKVTFTVSVQIKIE